MRQKKFAHSSNDYLAIIRVTGEAVDVQVLRSNASLLFSLKTTADTILESADQISTWDKLIDFVIADCKRLIDDGLLRP